MDSDTLRTQLSSRPGVTAPLTLAAITVEGTDAEDFLQGQLTLDLRELAPQDQRLTAWCNAKGRVWALLRIFRTTEGFVLLLPAEQSEAFVRRLRMFLLRAAARIEARELTIQGEIHTEDGEPGVERQADGWSLRLDSQRSLHLQAQARPVNEGDSGARFRALGLLANEPHITAATQEKFLPQSLGLQALGGLHFNKGCYVGQEIVARVHYRGRTPQQMVTLLNPEEARLDGAFMLDEVHVAGQRLVQIVEHIRGDTAA